MNYDIELLGTFLHKKIKAKICPKIRKNPRIKIKLGILAALACAGCLCMFLSLR